VADGLVERVTASGDRRRAEVRLTPIGRKRLRRAPAAPTDRLIQALQQWPARDAARLGTLLRRLNTDLGFEESGLLFAGEG
jgi:DNA-binding MarR family transcriptional regulator